MSDQGTFLIDKRLGRMPGFAINVTWSRPSIVMRTYF